MVVRAPTRRGDAIAGQLTGDGDGVEATEIR